jgi:hypothetical protein
MPLERLKGKLENNIKMNFTGIEIAPLQSPSWSRNFHRFMHSACISPSWDLILSQLNLVPNTHTHTHYPPYSCPRSRKFWPKFCICISPTPVPSVSSSLLLENGIWCRVLKVSLKMYKLWTILQPFFTKTPPLFQVFSVPELSPSALLLCAEVPSSLHIYKTHKIWVLIY